MAEQICKILCLIEVILKSYYKLISTFTLKCDKAMPGVVSMGYAHQTTKPMAVPHCPHGVDFGEIWRGYHRDYAYQAAKRGGGVKTTIYQLKRRGT